MKAFKNFKVLLMMLFVSLTTNAQVNWMVLDGR